MDLHRGAALSQTKTEIKKILNTPGDTPLAPGGAGIKVAGAVSQQLTDTNNTNSAPPIAAPTGMLPAGATEPKYNTTSDVPTPVPAEVDFFVKTLVVKSGDNFPNGVTVTATTNGNHSGRKHYDEKAVDIRYNAKDPKRALTDGAAAGARRGIDEAVNPSSKSSGPHFHFEW
jgi:hypothetical protein